MVSVSDSSMSSTAGHSTAVHPHQPSVASSSTSSSTHGLSATRIAAVHSLSPSALAAPPENNLVRLHRRKLERIQRMRELGRTRRNNRAAAVAAAAAAVAVNATGVSFANAMNNGSTSRQIAAAVSAVSAGVNYSSVDFSPNSSSMDHHFTIPESKSMNSNSLPSPIADTPSPSHLAEQRVDAEADVISMPIFRASALSYPLKSPISPSQ